MEDSVRALAHAYVTNTYEVWKCNSKIESIDKWIKIQKEILNDDTRR